MEGNRTSIKLDGNADGLVAASKKAKAAIADFGKSAKETQKQLREHSKVIKETAGIFDELGSAIGGMGGELTSTISSLATAATGIGAIVVVVGALAKAWKTSQENIDLYMKSADKLKAGSGGFTLDAQAALTDTKKRAKGQITAGYQQETKYYAKAFGAQRFLYTDEEKEYFKTLIAEGQQMQKNGRILLDSVRGIHDKTEWQKKYSALLKEEEILNDASLKNKEVWAGLEAELVRQRTIIQDKDSKSADKANAVINAELIANQLLKEKNGFLDKQIASVTALSEMTQTQEVVEDKLAELQTQKNINLREYGIDMLKVLKMESKVTKEIEKQVMIRQNGPSKVGVRGSGVLNAFINAENSKTGLQHNPIASMGESLNLTQNAIEELNKSFEALFTNVGGGFKGMVNAMLDSLKLLFAQLIGKAALFGLLQLLFPGSGMAVGALTNLRKFVGLPGFAGGTNFAPGGLAMVGERGPELVNLPRGSQVIPNGGGRLKLDLRGKFDGRDIYFAVENYAYTLDRNT